MSTMPTQADTSQPTEIDYSAFGADVDEEQSPIGQVTAKPEPDADDIEAAVDDVAEAVDDDIDDIENEADDPTADDPEYEIDEGIKLKKSEILDLHAKRENYSRYADELQVVATERQTLQKQTETFHDAIVQVQGEYNLALKFVEEFLPPAPDTALLAQNPQLYIVQKEMREQAIQKFNAMRDELNKSTQNGKTNYQKTMTEQEQVRAETEAGKLLKAVPALKDEKKFKSYMESIEGLMGKYGYQKQEIARMILADHNVALIARKAALYDKGKTPKQTQPMQQQQKTPKSFPAPSRIPGSSKNVTQRLQFNDTLKGVSSGKISRNSAMDIIASNFGD